MTKSSLLATLALLLMAALWPQEGTAQADFALPAPGGPYSIGAWSGALQTAAADELTAAPGDRRRLGLTVWYPAVRAGEARPWASPAMGAALARQFPFPEGFERSVTGHATEAPPAAEGPLPVIVFSPGLSFPPVLYQSLFERLASHGYVVVAVGHPHGVALVEYPDGTSITMEDWPSIDDEAEREAFLARYAAVWQADLEAVLDWVEAGAPSSPVAAHVDTDRIAAMGHSYGGTAVGRLSADPRVDATVLLEGAVRDPADENSRGHLVVTAPLMHIIGGYNRLEHEGAQYRPGPDAPVYQVVINGTGHAQLSDLIYLYSHYADAAWHERHRYETDPERVLQIISDHALAFFARYLNDSEEDAVLLRPKSYADRVADPGRAGYPETELSITVQ